jgi:hypothetical protein
MTLLLTPVMLLLPDLIKRQFSREYLVVTQQKLIASLKRTIKR